MVGGTIAGHRRSEHVWNLCHLPGLRRKVLCVGTLSLTVLLSADRPTTSLVAIFPGTFDPGRPARIPCNLLLLPKGILSSILPASPRLRGKRRRQRSVPRRDSFSVHSAKPPSLVPLPCVGISRRPLVGRN